MVAGIDIGMKLFREPPIGSLDVLAIGAAGEVQYGIQIAHLSLSCTHRRGKPLPPDQRRAISRSANRNDRHRPCRPDRRGVRRVAWDLEDVALALALVVNLATIFMGWPP